MNTRMMFARAVAGRFFGSRKRPCRWRGPFQTLCRESAVRHPKNGEVWYNTARMVKGK